jgi:DHA1 family bicyclomycin/chloramphenicol resistance-like MFS transporter
MKKEDTLYSESSMAGDTLYFAFLVLFIGSIVRIGASIYLPAMPLIADELHISKSLMSNTLTVYFVVFASFTLLAGILSDAYGRKRVLMSGMFFFILGSIVCALSDSYEMLMFGRMVQAFGASMVPGTLMAMIRDACSDLRVVSLMGWLTVLGGLFLVAAPIIGGVLTHFFGWNANFWFLALFTLVVFVLTFYSMQETHPDHARIPVDIRKTLNISLSMLRAPSFILVLAPVISFYAIQGAFLAAVPFILMGEYDLDPVTFGISNINIVIGLFSGRYIGMYILRKYGSPSVYKIGALSAIFVALLFIAIAMGWINGLWSFLIISGIFASVFGMMAPVGMKSSLSAFREVSGVAAAVQSALLFIASALGSAAIGVLMYRFEALSVETIFAIVSAVLCLIAALAALKNDNF